MGRNTPNPRAAGLPMHAGLGTPTNHAVDAPPRNRELERLVVDVLRATEVGAQARQEAWQVYADWLLSLGEPVGEWLAVSLRADDASDAVTEVRAKLDEIERACSFRLVDLALADLSEVPELARIADLTWERGFITTAAIRTRAFRAWDSELLEHTPDRLLEVILRSPSASMLHTLRVDACGWAAIGSRHPSVSALLCDVERPLAVRELDLGDGTDPLELGDGAFARLPELERLAIRSDEVGRRPEQVAIELGQLLPDRASGRSNRTPALSELDLRLRGGGDLVISALIEAELVEQLRRIRVDHITDVGAERVLAAADRFAGLDAFVLRHARLSQGCSDALGRLGARVASR